MPKKPTVCWYTLEGKYMGWTYLEKVTFGEARSWLRSNNFIFIGDNVMLSWTTSTTKLLNLFGRK